MWKKVLIIQTCLCLLLCAAYTAVSKTGSEYLKEKQSNAVAAVSKHHTVTDIWNKSRQAVTVLVKAPVTVTDYIINSQNQQKYGKPIDDVGAGETTSVYAVCGGQVIETGSNDTIGKYIKIKHEDAVSVYGNCSEVYVKEGQHVRQGYVIASFTNENNELYYDLIEE